MLSIKVRKYTTVTTPVLNDPPLVLQVRQNLVNKKSQFQLSYVCMLSAKCEDNGAERRKIQKRDTLYALTHIRSTGR